MRSLYHFLFNLLNYFVDPNFDFLFLLYVFLFRIDLLASALLLITVFSLASGSPCIPFVDESLTKSYEFSADIALFCCVFFVVYSSVQAQLIPTHLIRAYSWFW